MGRAAFDNIGNVHLAAVQPDDFQHIVQQMAGSPHKRFTLQIFIFTGAFADEHDFGVFIAYAEHYIVPCFAQGAVMTLCAGRFERIPIHHCVNLLCCSQESTSSYTSDRAVSLRISWRIPG